MARRLLPSLLAVGEGLQDHDFPLPWNPGYDSIHAVNVTERYVNKRVDLPQGSARVLFSARDKSGKRVALRVQLSQGTDATGPVSGDEKAPGKTRDETRDTNDFLEALLKKCQTYQITATDEEAKTVAWEFKTTEEDQQMISWEWKPHDEAKRDNQ